MGSLAGPKNTGTPAASWCGQRRGRETASRQPASFGRSLANVLVPTMRGETIRWVHIIVGPAILGSISAPVAARLASRPAMRRALRQSSVS